jgi:hypothetical protein
MYECEAEMKDVFHQKKKEKEMKDVLNAMGLRSTVF